MDGHVLGDIQLQTLDVTPQAHRARIGSRRGRGSRSGRRVQVRVDQDLLGRQIRDQHAGGVRELRDGVHLHRSRAIAQHVLLADRLEDGCPVERRPWVELGHDAGAACAPTDTEHSGRKACDR